MTHKFNLGSEVKIRDAKAENVSVGELIAWSQRLSDGGFSYLVRFDNSYYGLYMESDLQLCDSE